MGRLGHTPLSPKCSLCLSLSVSVCLAPSPPPSPFSLSLPLQCDLWSWLDVKNNLCLSLPLCVCVCGGGGGCCVCVCVSLSLSLSLSLIFAKTSLLFLLNCIYVKWECINLLVTQTTRKFGNLCILSGAGVSQLNSHETETQRGKQQHLTSPRSLIFVFKHSPWATLLVSSGCTHRGGGGGGGEGEELVRDVRE